ncbi:hypothetical protein SRB17_25820 [Streptomyces sp. RB17]|nr:hypothetical protein [Streptomyces sp. RB17]MQY34612.1 hypothetical protein [Streptomyces sp. RB17]
MSHTEAHIQRAFITLMSQRLVRRHRHIAEVTAVVPTTDVPVRE